MPTRRPQPAEGTSRRAGAILLALTAIALSLAFAGFGPRVAAAEAAPTASFTVSEKPTVGMPVVFDASASTGEITSYKWDFGDGQKGEGETVAHTYAKASSYTVKLTVENGAKETNETKPTVVVKAQQTISFSSTAPSEAVVGGSPYTVQAKATSELPVTFSSDAPSVCAVSGPTVSFVGAGVCVIAANQGGDGTYNPAPQATQFFAVTRRSQTISFTSVAPTGALAGGPPYTVQAEASSGLPVSFSSSTPAVCSVSGATVSFLVAGTCTVSANQPGNEAFYPASQASQTFAVAAAPVFAPVPTPVPTPLPKSVTLPKGSPNSGFSGHASFNTKSGAITASVTVANPGAFRWVATFQNGKFGVFAARVHRCKAGQVRLKGSCRPGNVTFGKGSKVVAAAGPVTFVVKPTSLARRALKVAAKRKKGVPVTLTITFKSALGGTAVTHAVALTVKLKS